MKRRNKGLPAIRGWKPLLLVDEIWSFGYRVGDQVGKCIFDAQELREIHRSVEHAKPIYTLYFD